MTEKELRQQVADIAYGLMGLNESDGSFKPIIDGYNTIRPLPRSYKVKYTDEWCAATVSEVGHRAGLLDIVFAECSCAKMIDLYKKAGRWMEDDNYTPEPGDIIMYDWEDTGKGDNTGWPNHVGIVWKVVSGYIFVIEGNYNRAVRIRQIKVGARYIRGYCLPDYASKATATTPAAPAEPIAKDTDVDITYQVYTDRWLPPVRNLEDFAGIEGKPIKGLAICGVSAGRIKYQVHTKKGWLGIIWAENYDLGNLQTGFAGDLVNEIDAIRAYYYTPDDIRPYKAVEYRVDTIKRQTYYAWQVDFDTDKGQDGYAGVLGGAPIDRVQMVIK